MSSVSLLRAVSFRTRIMLVVVAALGLAARVAVMVAAVAALTAEAARAASFALGASGAWLLLRLLASQLRITVECELYRTTSAALLDGDVLEVHATDLQRAAIEANQHARSYIVGTLPSLAADVVASLVLVPAVLYALPSRVVMVAVLALAIVVFSMAGVRLATRRLHERALAASEQIYVDMLRATSGRLEIVARGGEAEHAEQLGRDLEEYARVARGANLRAAALGRIPVVLAASAVVAAAVGDAAVRSALESAVVTQALLLAALTPPVLGVVVGVAELIRLDALVRPLVKLLTAPHRDEIGRHDGEATTLPAPIEVADVSFAYGDRHGLILDDVSFVWRPDAPLVVVGPNGAGKSTLLRLLLGLRRPTRGTIRVGDVELSKIDLTKMRRDVAYLPQRPYLGEPYTTLREALKSAHRSATDETMRRALERVGLAGRALTDPLGELSAGQRQRVALARVLIQPASMIVLDEPDANLDGDGIRFVRALVDELVRAGKMVAVAAHTTELAQMKGSVQVALDDHEPTVDAVG